VLVVAACGTGSDDTSVVVSAASSLAGAFAEIAERFEEANPGITVDLNLGGSASLREQILGGAAVDVFASANQATMAPVADLAVIPPVVFAANEIELAVPRGNPGAVRGLSAVGDEGLFVGLCAEPVPCGALSTELLAAAGVDARPDTVEPNVRSLVAKLEAGELDVALVYRTDVVSSNGIEAVEHGQGGPFANAYLIAPLVDSSSALRFVDFVVSPAGQEILAEYGFAGP